MNIQRMFSLRCGQTLIVRLIQLSLQDASQSQLVHGVLRIYAVWSSLEIIAEQESQLLHQVLMAQIQVYPLCLLVLSNSLFFSTVIINQ